MNAQATANPRNFGEWIATVGKNPRLMISPEAAAAMKLAWARVVASERSPLDAWRAEWDTARVARVAAWDATESALRYTVPNHCRKAEALAVEVLAWVADCLAKCCS